MISLRLVRVIEIHSDELAAELIAKLEASSRTADLRKVPVEELRGRIQEIFRHLERVTAHQDGTRYRKALF